MLDMVFEYYQVAIFVCYFIMMPVSRLDARGERRRFAPNERRSNGQAMKPREVDG
jgi:hypothetical protein